jgi:hypothetical protein
MQPTTRPAPDRVPTTTRHRRSVRIRTDARLDLAADDEVLLDHRIVNINLDGLAIDAPVLQPVGTVVELSIHFPDLGESVETAGEVVWVREAPTRLMGIRFRDLLRAERALLARYLYASGQEDP